MTMQDTGSDERRHNFFIVDNEVLDSYDLSPFTGWLYITIVRMINQKTGEAFPSLATLADKAKMSKPKVIEAIAELEAKHLLKVVRKTRKGTREKSVNHYRLLPVIKREVVNVIDNVVSDVDSINTNTIKTEEIVSAKAPRARSEGQQKLDRMVDALVAVLKLDPDTIPEKRWSSLRGIGKQLLAVSATPADIPGLFAYTQRKRKGEVNEYNLGYLYPDYQRDRNKTTDDSAPAVLATSTPQQRALEAMYRETEGQPS